MSWGVGGKGLKTYFTSKQQQDKRVRWPCQALPFFSTSNTSTKLSAWPKLCQLYRRRPLMCQKSQNQAKMRDQMRKYVIRSTWKPFTKSLHWLIKTLWSRLNGLRSFFFFILAIMSSKCERRFSKARYTILACQIDLSNYIMESGEVLLIGISWFI